MRTSRDVLGASLVFVDSLSKNEVPLATFGASSSIIDAVSTSDVEVILDAVKGIASLPFGKTKAVVVEITADKDKAIAATARTTELATACILLFFLLFCAAFSLFLFSKEKLKEIAFFSFSSRFLIGRATRARVAAIFPRVQVSLLLAQLNNVAGLTVHAAHHIWGDSNIFTCKQLLVAVDFFPAFL